MSVFLFGAFVNAVNCKGVRKSKSRQKRQWKYLFFLDFWNDPQASFQISLLMYKFHDTNEGMRPKLFPVTQTSKSPTPLPPIFLIWNFHDTNGIMRPKLIPGTRTGISPTLLSPPLPSFHLKQITSPIIC